MAVMECRQQNNVGTSVQELRDVASGCLHHTICKFGSSSPSTRTVTKVTVPQLKEPLILEVGRGGWDFSQGQTCLFNDTVPTGKVIRMATEFL